MPSLFERYQNTRKKTEQLCAPLLIEDYIPQPVEYVSPPKWHLAHVTWFFEEMVLKKYFVDYKTFDDNFAFLFNSYYQSMGQRGLRCERGIMTRPSVTTVYQYRQYVDQHIQKLLSQDISDTIIGLIILGINHEQQHQELLLTDLKYTLSLNPTFPVYDANCNLVDSTNTANTNIDDGWLTVKQGQYQIGFQADDENKFCFDNELGTHKVLLQDYSIAKGLVTNGEYLTFIEDGGYQQFQHWLDEGWSWVTNNHIEAPLYWHNIKGEWFYFTLAGLKPVNMNAILSHVNFYEADAFARWANYRLPTEFEWEAASNQLDWGRRWEWTSSAYRPYPNFTISKGAVGEYNGKFMINQMVLRGASVATDNGHSRASYRNFFPPHLQWQYSGIRLAK